MNKFATPLIRAMATASFIVAGDAGAHIIISPDSNQVELNAGEYLMAAECPQCPFLELIDVTSDPDARSFGTLPGFQVSTEATLRDPVPGVRDDPRKLNVRFEYVGLARIAGPAALGALTVRLPARLPSTFQYVGQAFNSETNVLEVNSGVAILGAPARERWASSDWKLRVLLGVDSRPDAIVRAGPRREHESGLLPVVSHLRFLSPLNPCFDVWPSVTPYSI